MLSYDSLLPNRLVSGKFIFTKPTTIHFLTDFKTGVLDYKNDFIFDINKLQGIVIKSNMIRIGSISLNPRKYFVETKKEFSRTFNDTLDNIPDGKLQIIDHSIITNGLQSFIEKNPKVGFFYLFNYLKNEFIYTKAKNKDIENVVLFNFKNNGMYDLLGKALKQLSSKSENFNFFDNNLIATCNSKSIVFGYYKNTNIEINFSAYNKLRSIVEDVKIIANDEDTDSEFNSPPIVNTKNVRNLINSKELKDVNYNKLKESFKNIKINSSDVEKNIEIALKNNLKNNKESTEETVDDIILKTINKTIYNNENVSVEDQINPDLLLNKVKIYENQYSDDIKFQKNTKASNINLVKPTNDIIKIDNVTGPSRHKFEFNEQIHSHVEKLFKTLEEKNLPIEIINFEHEVKDNNLDRFIEYKITLKNKAAGLSTPYTVKLKVPDVINGRYFKLNGKEYILSSQQFLKPLTKSTPTEARFLSHYNMITQRVVNFKYSPSDIKSILKYVSGKYSKYVEEYSENYIKFKSGEIIDLTSKTPFESPTEKLELSDGKYKYSRDDLVYDKEFKRNEFLYNKLHSIINGFNPNDELKNSIRSLQYVDIYVMGKYIPLIFALWQQLGLTDSLLKLGIDFEVADKLDESNNNSKTMTFELLDDKYLIIRPDSKRQEYIINGLYKLDILKNIKSDDLNVPSSCNEYISDTYGSKIINNLNTMVEISIDPITKELLEYENLPTNIIDIISGPLLDKLFNDEPDHPSDLSTLRVRLSEYMTHIMYTEIAMAYRTYKDKLTYDSDSKIFLDENYILKNLLNQHAHSEATGSSLIDYVEPYSPVDEIIKSSKVVRTGIGGE
jgi:hypothetical protein